MIEIPFYSKYSLKYPHRHLIYLQSCPLEFPPEGNSSLRLFLKDPTSPFSFEDNNIVLQNLMTILGGGICGGNQTQPPPPINL